MEKRNGLDGPHDIEVGMSSKSWSEEDRYLIVTVSESFNRSEDVVEILLLIS